MRRKIQLLLLTLLIFVISSQTIVNAAGLSIRYDGKTVNYSDKQLKIKIQGKAIDVSENPGILIDGIAFVPYTQVFNKAVGVTSKYNAKDKSITFKSNDNTVIVVLGSKNALINGKKTTLKASPKLVTFQNTKSSKMMVPSRAIADGLDLNYSYSNGTVNVSKKEAEPMKGRAIQYGGKIYDYVKKEVNVKINGKKIDLTMPGLILDNVAMLPAYGTFAKSDLDIAYDYDSSTKTVTLSTFDHIIVYTLNSKTAKVDHKTMTLTQPARVIKDIASGKNYVFVPGSFTTTNLGYDYAWDNSSATSIITTADEEEETTTENSGETPTGTDTTDSEATTETGADQSADYSVRIPIPTGVKAAEVSETDDYHNRQYIITVPSDQRDFFRQNPITNNKKHAKSISTRLNIDGDTEILIKTTTIKGFKITNTKNYIDVTIKSPKQTYNKIIVIDPGHGEGDPGAVRNGLKEKDLTLKISQYAKNYFETDDSIKVYYTRLTDKQVGITVGAGVANHIVSVKNRAVFANEIGADLLVSVHINAVDNAPSARGVEVLYSSNNTSKSDGGINSKQLATYLYNDLVKATGATGIQKRGVKDRKNLIVLYQSKIPAALMEINFLSNKEDAAFLKNEKNMDKIAKNIYSSVVDVFDDYPSKR